MDTQINLSLQTELQLGKQSTGIFWAGIGSGQCHTHLGSHLLLPVGGPVVRDHVATQQVLLLVQ